MANVKVHLREIIKYVLLLGLGIQSILGTVSGVLWLAQGGITWDDLKSLLGVMVCCILSYVFLLAWDRTKPGWLYALGTGGILTNPVILQSALDAGKELVIGALLCLVFICFLVAEKRLKKRIARMGGTIFLLVLILILCNMGTGAPSFAARVASRCCYPQLYSSVSNTPQSLQDKTGYLELRDSLRSADGIYAILYPALLERHGDMAGADATCYELAWYGLGNNTKDVVINALWDVAGYHFPGPVAELQLLGKGYDSVTGHNYGALTEKIGAFTQVHWNYGVVWSVLTMLLAIGLHILYTGQQDRSWLGLLLLFEVAVLCFVMHGAGAFDYKNLPVTELIKMGFLLDGWKIMNRNKDE